MLRAFTMVCNHPVVLLQGSFPLPTAPMKQQPPIPPLPRPRPCPGQPPFCHHAMNLMVPGTSEKWSRAVFV